MVTVQGVSIHPGQAKDKLVNALHLAAKIVDTLPQVTLTPETTDGRQGFIHLYEMNGTAAAAELQLHPARLRARRAAAHGELLQQVCAAVQATEPRATIACDDHAAVPQHALLAGDTTCARSSWRARPAGGSASSRSPTPIRGGTDGSRLTELGVPTPNLFTGMQNIHGPLEWISVQDMAAATRVCDPPRRALGRGAQALMPFP